MTITITRSFSRTKQVQAFEPINAFCSVQAELEFDEGDQFPFHEGGSADPQMMEMALRLDEFVRAEVEKTIAAEITKRQHPQEEPTIQMSAKAEADPAIASLDRTIDRQATGGYRSI